MDKNTRHKKLVDQEKQGWRLRQVRIEKRSAADWGTTVRLHFSHPTKGSWSDEVLLGDQSDLDTAIEDIRSTLNEET